MIKQIIKQTANQKLINITLRICNYLYYELKVLKSNFPEKNFVPYYESLDDKFKDLRAQLYRNSMLNVDVERNLNKIINDIKSLDNVNYIKDFFKLEEALSKF